MEIPYTQLQLHIALMGLNEKKLKEIEAKSKELIDELTVLAPSDKKDLNQKVAEYQGISVQELINSANYGILKAEYADKTIKELVQKIQEKFDITETQSWAIFALTAGLLN